MRAKGQYRIIFETMLILVGIFITGYAITNFSSLQGNVQRIALADNFNTIANQVTIGLIKVSHGQGDLMRIQIPRKLADMMYMIRLENDTISVASLPDRSITITKQIFNIGQVNKITISQVISSAGIVEIVSESGTLRIRRG